jgi:hypothetical protein
MFKNAFLVGVLMLILSACGDSPKPSNGISTNDVTNSASADGTDDSDLPKIKFEEEIHDFGRITQGEKVSFAFKFTNVGKTNLIISSAAGSCGCTVPEWPKEPVLPGKEGKINVIFSSEGKSGMQEKTITIVTNCEPSTQEIRIKTNIIVPTETVKEER